MHKRSKFKACKNCQKPVIPEDKNCPYCGFKVKKEVLPKLIIGVLVLTLFGSLAIPTTSKLEKEREKIANASVDVVNIRELAKILTNKNAQADIEIQNKVREIEGKIVELQLQVFVATYMSDYYRIVTIPSSGTPRTLLTLYPKNKAESDFLKNIKPGQTIKIKGKIKGTYLKSIKIDPAFLI